MLDRYPPKPYASSGGASPRVLDRHADRAGPEPTASAPAAVPGGAGEAPTATEPPAKGLLSLERPFDVDDFAQQLGETTLRVTVPRDSLAEVLRRVADFMGFGIYVYAVRVQPAPSELLRSFVVELQRVDFSPADGAWVPFRELGRSESPFGPGGEPGARR